MASANKSHICPPWTGPLPGCVVGRPRPGASPWTPLLASSAQPPGEPSAGPGLGTKTPLERVFLSRPPPHTPGRLERTRVGRAEKVGARLPGFRSRGSGWGSRRKCLWLEARQGSMRA